MTNASRQEYRTRFRRFQKRYELIYTPKINAALREQINQFISTGTTMAITSEPIYAVLKDLYVTVGPVWAAYTNSLLPRNKARMPMGFSERIVSYMRHYFLSILQIAENITAKTREIIQRILGNAAETGDSFDDIVKTIRSTTELGKVRARLIARTEVLGAANKASYENAKATGLELNKVWISCKDNRVRVIPKDKFDHLVMDGVKIGLHDMFNVQGETLEYPGDKEHGATASNLCNCRCVAGFWVVGD